MLPPGPYMYPLLLKQGNKIREKLLKKKIYIPTLWKNIIKILPADDIEYKLAKNILPLPCDQRYGGEMEYIVQLILEEMTAKH